jgi:lauroyl/myristoyl acyltransferase
VGLEILPTSTSSMRIAIERMQQGETVLTGIDHPLEQAKYKPRLFGQPAHLPVHYVQLALKANVPVILLASVKDKDGIYRILSSDEIYLQSYAQRQEQIIRNAEMILQIAEGFIQPHLEQWTLVQPVYPEAIERMP